MFLSGDAEEAIISGADHMTGISETCRIDNLILEYILSLRNTNVGVKVCAGHRY